MSTAPADALRATVHAHLGERRDEVLALTSTLVAARSENLPGDETAPAAVVRDWLASHGLPAARTLAREAHRPNLLITLDSGRPGPRLGLCGHLDTKPVGDGAALWQTDPFTATIVGDRLFGLGTTDMKGAVAAMLVAGSAIAPVIDQLCGSLTLILTADEEYGSYYGAEYLAETGLEVDEIVLGEPSGVHEDWDGLRIVSRGITCFKVRVFGDQMHSSLTDQFPVVNAVDHMSQLYVGLKAAFHPSFPVHPLCPGGPTVNLGVKTLGGVGFGVNAGLAEFWCDVRLTPGMTPKQFDLDLRTALATAASGTPGIRYEYEYRSPLTWLEATEVAADAPLTIACQEAFRRATGREITPACFAGASDAYPFQFIAGIPTIASFGPGLLTPAHGPNEWISLQSLNEAPAVYAELILNYLDPARVS